MGVEGLCDSHCHLDFEQFDPIREQVLLESYRVGVRDIVVPGVEAQYWDRLCQLCFSQQQHDHPRLWASLGLHPCFIEKHQPGDLARLEKLLRARGSGSLCRVVAVGEIGLDFWLPDSDRSTQLALFSEQLVLAKKFDLPVLLHARKSHDQVLQQLRGTPLGRGGIVHAFSGSLQQAEQYIALGFKLGVGGAVTYPRATKLRSTIKLLGEEHWVLETDAPDMPLYGMQGRINRPDNIPLVLQALAELFERDERQLAVQLRQNAETVLPELATA
ncbi:MAG: TatD family hydrolase [Motiliproteus sp.]